MKKYIYLAALMLTLTACSETEEPSIGPEVWRFTGYTCTFCSEPEKFVPVSDSLYFYTFFPDSTFTKTIGAFELKGDILFEENTNDLKFLILKYDEASVALDRAEDNWAGLIHYCGQEFEPLSLNEDGTLSGAWGACDGPRLIFERDESTPNSIIF